MKLNWNFHKSVGGGGGGGVPNQEAFSGWGMDNLWVKAMKVTHCFSVAN